MALMPKRVKYRKVQRGSYAGNAQSRNKLDFGDFGLLLVSLLETILVTFGLPFLHKFSEGFQGPLKSQVRRKWVGFSWYLGSSNKYYRSKSASLQKVVSLSADQLTCKQQITDL